VKLNASGPTDCAVPWEYTIDTRIGPQNNSAYQTTIDDAWLTTNLCPPNVSSIALTNNVDIVGGFKFVALSGGRSTASITLINSSTGTISGVGGDRAGSTSSPAGGSGGPAITAERAITVTNYGIIGGGGGAGATGSYGGYSHPGGAVLGGGGCGRGATGSGNGGSLGNAGNVGSADNGGAKSGGGGGGSAGGSGGWGTHSNIGRNGGSGGPAVSGKSFVNGGAGLSNPATIGAALTLGTFYGSQV
jgi:hypothetical protein